MPVPVSWEIDPRSRGFGVNVQQSGFETQYVLVTHKNHLPPPQFSFPPRPSGCREPCTGPGAWCCSRGVVGELSALGGDGRRKKELSIVLDRVLESAGIKTFDAPIREVD